MPFTAAHPAIVLPLIRSRFASATGLIAGSVAPDFEYFFKLSVESRYSHTLWGLVYFNVPVALGLALLFHLVVKRNLLVNLPNSISHRFVETSTFDFISYLTTKPVTFLLSALVGAASHLFWDSFTHNGGYFAQRLWFYRGTYFPYDGVKYPLFYVLQHLSTVAGLFIIAVYVARKTCVVHDASKTKIKWAYWLLVMGITLIVYWLRFTLNHGDYMLGNIVVTLISGSLIAVVIGGLLPLYSTSNPLQEN